MADRRNGGARLTPLGIRRRDLHVLVSVFKTVNHRFKNGLVLNTDVAAKAIEFLSLATVEDQSPQ